MSLCFPLRCRGLMKKT